MEESCERDFQSSQLGTREYWNEVYEKELWNFNGTGDVGEIWFGENGQKRILDWITKNKNVKFEDAIIDLGCGNGVMLIGLEQQGFNNLTGLDYSQNAIDLARAVSREKEITDITFECGDILSDQHDSPKCLRQQYQLCLDKGTYDAVSLVMDFQKAKATYKRTIKRIMDDSGLFILTSCNWTKTQLLDHFSKDFSLQEVIPTPTMQFGGKTGHNVVSLVFKKRCFSEITV